MGQQVLKLRPPLSTIYEASPESEDGWQEYDPMIWETAHKSKASTARPSIPIADATFVRALTASVPGCKPNFRSGDILRIIGHRRRGDEYYEVLQLKPPGQSGRALRKSLEGVDQEVVNQVGREARTEEQLKCFRTAMDWDD